MGREGRRAGRREGKKEQYFLNRKAQLHHRCQLATLTNPYRLRPGIHTHLSPAPHTTSTRCGQDQSLPKTEGSNQRLRLPTWFSPHLPVSVWDTFFLLGAQTETLRVILDLSLSLTPRLIPQQIPASKYTQIVATSHHFRLYHCLGWIFPKSRAGRGLRAVYLEDCHRKQESVSGREGGRDGGKPNSVPPQAHGCRQWGFDSVRTAHLKDGALGH